MPTTVPETAARTETETGEETGKSTEEQADSEESVSETEDLSTLSEEELQKEQARKDEEARMEVVRQLMKEMTLREKIGQLLMPALRVYQYENGSYSSELLSSEQRAAISELKLGGLILFEESLRTVEGTKKLSRDLQEANALGGATSGLLLATDQEGGYVTRLAKGTMMPGNMALGAAADPAYTEQAAFVIGSELHELGIHIDFAPDADVNSNPENPIIGVRSFSDDPEMAAVLTEAYIGGLHRAKTAAAVKHFPGHGDTKTDSHSGLPVIGKSLDELRSFELQPFAAACESADIVMTAHICYPMIETETVISLDSAQEISLPATLSYEIITKLLREELGFQGVVTTDALYMGAVSAHFSTMEIAKRALNAGVDLLLMPGDLKNAENIQALKAYVSGIEALVESGEVPLARIDEAAERILLLKGRYGLLPGFREEAERDEADPQSGIGSAAHHEIEWEIAKAAVTLLKNDGGLLPAKNVREAVVACPYDTQLHSVRFAEEKLRESGALSESAVIRAFSYAALTPQEAVQQIGNAELVVGISTMYSWGELSHSAASASCLDAMIKAAKESGKGFVLLSAQLPYDTARYPGADAILACFCARGMPEYPDYASSECTQYGPNLPAALVTVFGGNTPRGQLPVRIPEVTEDARPGEAIIYERGFGLSY